MRELASNHSAYYLDHSIVPAPTLISNGFTDDLFPVDEAVRWVNKVKAEVSEGQGRPAPLRLRPPARAEQGRRPGAPPGRTHEWFDRYVKGEHERPLKGVEAMTQTCPRDAPSGGPYSARTWDALTPGEVRYRHDATKVVLSTSGNPAIGARLDPIFGGGACVAVSAADEPARRPIA